MLNSVFERKTVARIQREQHAVIDRRRLDLEIERLAQPLSNRQAEPAIEADSERRVDDDLRAAEAVEEALDHDRLSRRESRRAPRPRAARSRRPASPRASDIAHSLISQVFGATSLRSSRDSRFRGAGRLSRSTAPASGPPASVSQNGSVGAIPGAGSTIRRPREMRWICHGIEPSEKTSPRADSCAKSSSTSPILRPCGFDHDVVVAGFGNRSARSDRRQARRRCAVERGALTRSKKIFGAAPMIRSGSSAASCLSSMAKCGRVELGEVVRAAQNRAAARLSADFVLLGGDRDDLLRGDIDASHRDFHFVEMPARESRAPPRRIRARSSRVSAKKRPLGVAPRLWPERPMRWIAAEIDLGVSSWQTSSTAPTSMPSSSDAVATIAFSSPRLRRCSAIAGARRARGCHDAP